MVLGWLFALPGIGHIYVGKFGKGIGILILGIALYVVTIIMIYSVGLVASLEQSNSIVTNNSTGGAAIGIMLVMSITYIALFIWQIFNARKLAKKFNETVRTTGKEPW